MPQGPSLTWYPPGRTKVSVDLQEASSEAECSGFALYIPANNLPPGFRPEGCSQSAVLWKDGSTTASNYFASYWVEGKFPINLGRALLRPGASWEVVDETPPTVLSLTTVGSTEVVVRHQQEGAAFQGPFTVYFMSGDVVTEIEAEGLDVRDLLTIAEGMILAAQAVENE